MTYKIINEDNTLVKDYPSPEIYKTMSDEEKKNIFTFKNEIEKITIPRGLGRVYVNVTYDEGMLLEKEFIIKSTNGYTREYYKKEIGKIYDYISSFSKKNNLYDFYLGCHIFIK